MNERIIIDAENAVLGRVASYAAKQALLGKIVVVVNSKKAVILGSQKNIVTRYLIKKSKGGYGLKGPFIHTTPEKIMKRTIRNMLPYQEGRGRMIFKTIRCYNLIPEEFKNSKFEDLGKIRLERINKGITLAYLSKVLRGGK